MTKETKTYLGDGVYAELQPEDMIRLYVEAGGDDGLPQEIYLDSGVLRKLRDWLQELAK